MPADRIKLNKYIEEIKRLTLDKKIVNNTGEGFFGRITILVQDGDYQLIEVKETIK